MEIRPELRALRGDDTPQRVAQNRLFQALADWRKHPDVRDVLDALAGFSGGGALGEFPALVRLFGAEGEGASRFANELVARLVDTLADAPLGHVPLRHFTDGMTSTLQIARAGNAALVLVCMDGEAHRHRPEPLSINFSPSETWEHVLAGSAQGESVECRPTGPREAEIVRRDVALTAGTVVARDCRRQGLLLRQIDGRLVMLRLSRRGGGSELACEYELASGRLIHQAAGNPRDSRHELMTALLGRMQRADAAPLLADMAQERAGSAALRWQALRECLGLDTLIGFTALSAIARSADDPLAATAGALRAQLIEAHSQLAGIELCPA